MIIKSFLKKMINKLGYEITPVMSRRNSDDPYLILQRLLGKNTVTNVVDVGASIGDISEHFCNLFPKTIVHAFEPYQPFHEFIRQKIVKNSKIKLVPFAVAENSGDVVMHVNQSEGTNSLLKPDIEGKSSIYGELLKRKDTVNVKATTIDEWIKKSRIKKVDILKLDIQGMELEAIKGASESLDNGKVMSIVCEIMLNKCYQKQASWADLVTEIIDHGFTLFNFFDYHYANGQLCQTDGLFIHNSILESVLKKSGGQFHSFSNILVD